MSKLFDMHLFMSGVLHGSKATKQRHLRQSLIIQAAIQKRWQRDNPWSWKAKHIRWFIVDHLKNRSINTKYYYQLTIQLIQKRLDR
ncbi:hypothetical protein [Pseudomonas putida]|uniref:hypothetical protein n=1 Tax=Pseudomonas putida TaxID=303 RepID=UPI000BF148F0|nr:hypothetical protein [Pseudomonas putida]MDD2023167.1 hypothetical protein [Pseudomonas putida]PEI07459.1 hypothetical protein CRM86_06070 [Pseudomonas putida]